MNSVKDTLISTKFSSKKREIHLEYVLPFHAIDEAPAYKTGHLISWKIPVQRIPGQFVKKCIDLIVTFFFSYKNQFMDVNRTVLYHFIANFFFQSNF